MKEWRDGDFELEVELKLVINYQDKGKLYYQVFLKGDEKGECEITRFLPDEDKVWIETCVIEKLNEGDNDD
jgi:hypothetical protein